MRTRVSSTRFLWCILWLNDTSYCKSVWRVKYRNMPARNTLVQLLAMYTNPESHNAQRHRQTDRPTDGRQDDANSGSYCVAVRSAKKPKALSFQTGWIQILAGLFRKITMHRLTELGFWFDLIISWRLPWLSFTQPICEYAVVHSYLLHIVV